MKAQEGIPRKRRQWWPVIPVLALLLAGGVIAYQANQEPEPEPPLLLPAASYELPASRYGSPLLFSAQGVGYPAVSTALEKVGNRFDIRNRVLDDLCRPLDAVMPISGTNISPTRELISWVTGAQFTFRRRDGSLAHVPCPTDGVSGPGPCPYSDGVIGYIDRGKIDRVWLYAPDGSDIPPPPFADDQRIALGVASADDRLIPLTDRTKLFLYDITAKKIVLETPFPSGQTAMIWRHEDRLLLAPRSGNALVFDGTKQIATIAPGADGWRWGEDGTVWTLTDGKLRVLRWQAGAPKLVKVSTSGKPGTRYGSLAPGLGSEPPFRENTEPDWAAVWGDGQLVAGVEELTTADGEARRLTLYRDNSRLGYFQLPTKPRQAEDAPEPMVGRGGPWKGPKTDNHEHLAFTADGKYLSWAIDDGTGVRLLVFEAPPK